MDELPSMLRSDLVKALNGRRDNDVHVLVPLETGDRMPHRRRRTDPRNELSPDTWADPVDGHAYERHSSAYGAAEQWLIAQGVHLVPEVKRG